MIADRRRCPLIGKTGKPKLTQIGVSPSLTRAHALGWREERIAAWSRAQRHD
jgi:hypothetical protein